ncbi:MAG: hypothetical protein R3D01_14560 [Hyphomicrobiales bacterium]
METLSPSADRIGAALRALRMTHTPGAGDAAALGAKCLRAVIAELAADGVSQDDLKPLVDLEAHLGGVMEQGQDQPATHEQVADPSRNRRRGTSPSFALLARVAAVIDLLVKAGYDENEAAQTVMRRMVIAGVPPPQRGGDARGWRRLLEWRNSLLQGVGPEEAKLEYQAFSREIEDIPANERVKRVLDDRLWDRRRKPR